MSAEDAQVVRALIEGFIAGDVRWDLLDEEVELRDYDIPDAGTYRGHAGMARWVEDWQAGLPDVTIELQETIDAGDAVIAVLLLHARPRGSDVAVHRQDAVVYALRGGRIISIDYYNSKPQALRAAGLADPA